MKRLIGWLFLRVLGWRIVGDVPRLPKFVFVGAPHTSNWDFPLFVGVAWSTGLPLAFLGKHTLFKGPTGWFFRAMGGISVDRSKPHGVVGEVTRAFENAERIAVTLSPEGTRARREHWRSGFYHLARAADVPLALGTLDFERKLAIFGPVLKLTGNMQEDMKPIRAFYGDIVPKHPELFGPVRLVEEESSPEPSEGDPPSSERSDSETTSSPEET